MEVIFQEILDLSITGGSVILAILIIRLSLINVPRFFSYILWIIPAIKLLIPVSFTGIWSICPDIMPYVSSIFQNMPYRQDVLYKGFVISNQAVTGTAVMHQFFYWFPFIWLAGSVCLLCYGMFSYIKLWRRLEVSIQLENNIYIADFIPTGFVIGILHPRIYIPSSLAEGELEYVVLHEKIHIKRHDYLALVLAYILLCIHWFNPFVWLGFCMFIQDMEMSCDERVIMEAGEENRKCYARIMAGTVLRKAYPGVFTMFHGSNMERRLKNIMKEKDNSQKAKLVSGIIVFTAAVLLIPGYISIKSRGEEKQRKQDIISENNTAGDNKTYTEEPAGKAIEEYIGKPGYEDSATGTFYVYPTGMYSYSADDDGRITIISNNTDTPDSVLIEKIKEMQELLNKR